jgi:hypothetical protein
MEKLIVAALLSTWIGWTGAFRAYGGDEAVVVIPPARSDYVACCPPNGEMFETVYALVKRYPDVRLLDLFRSPAFVDADFGDSDHLAPRGAAKLTELIERR